jgi:hypothetical protein
VRSRLVAVIGIVANGPCPLMRPRVGPFAKSSLYELPHNSPLRTVIFQKHGQSAWIQAHELRGATMTKTVARFALFAGLLGLLALTGMPRSFAQARTGTETETGYRSSYCVPPSGESLEEQRVYCEGWRAVRRGW